MAKAEVDLTVTIEVSKVLTVSNVGRRLICLLRRDFPTLADREDYVLILHKWIVLATERLCDLEFDVELEALFKKISKFLDGRVMDVEFLK